MPHPLSHKYPIPISQLCLVNTDVPAGVGAPPLDSTAHMFGGINFGNLVKNSPIRQIKILAKVSGYTVR